MVEKVCKFLNAILIIILLVIAGIMIIPKFVGGQTLSVLSGSMEPGIPVGSLIVITDVNANELEVDDVITFKVSDSTLVTHRIVEIDEEQQLYTTKGDANETNDGNQISHNNIVGKLVFSVPLLGYLSIYMQTPLGIAFLCGIVIVLLLLNYLPEILKKNEKNKEKVE